MMKKIALWQSIYLVIIPTYRYPYMRLYGYLRTKVCKRPTQHPVVIFPGPSHSRCFFCFATNQGTGTCHAIAHRYYISLVRSTRLQQRSAADSGLPASLPPCLPACLLGGRQTVIDDRASDNILIDQANSI
ncbi:hypothetical protein BO70DRAFT_375888 [Aspergillus heteromorphus CBS 117.55]|uniref:Uncharacterized protein n=1 Tax=Aspergillus heteromorphus CBS 117.55 TaxID=1448321 RepID=A0A317X1W4_9EURO|nr:uncharacterized protein BO70DRAFT_375888 [Aspergillus heteromorphus CBS 117.55]PWY92121.1 hypothetical protein BO70DRAFT_375888 [Aspergillus heteromorphus CBS 117.55]